MITRFIRPAIVTVATGTLVLTACGGSSDAEPAAPVTSDSPSTADATAFNDADVVFAQGMIPHHEQAVEMATIALAPESEASPEVEELARAIQSAQDPEIEMMTSLLQAWGQPIAMPGMDDMDDMEHMAGMEGMMTADEMTELSSLTGPDFDTAWFTMMIAHHQGAITQAETVAASGTNQDIAALADQIIGGQQAEIDQMYALLER